MVATIYMIFGRLARVLHAEKHSIVRVGLLTKLFVGGDVLAFLVQGGAAGILMVQSMASAGKALVVPGLIIQIVSLDPDCIFRSLRGVTSAVFHKRFVNDITLKAMSLDIPWMRIMRLMYAIGLMIMIRSISRLVEYEQGTVGYCMRHEWTFYVFNSVPVMLSAILMLYWFPAMLRVNFRWHCIFANKRNTRETREKTHFL